MPLESGTRIGVYEVVSLLGAGGMGEVYRAFDTRLKREVALKVLPSSLAADSDRLLRFAREAEMLAALNHPKIAAIYGVEEGAAEGRDAGRPMALVMELVDGETLADRIARGSVPVDEALAIAHDLAEALGFAHEQGIVHRDLKPANIKVRDDGTVKVLDFGLAKLAEPAMSAAGSGSSMSPTITSPALMTNAGMLLGTAAYMSPEQAKGKPADKRSDMWAFGCVLFEMLAGKRAFDGEDISETLASVLRSEPEWSSLPAATPPAVRTLIRRCLEKDRRKRAADCAAALFALDEHPHLVAPAPAADGTAFQRELELAVGSAQRVVERRARTRLIGGSVAALLLTVAASAATWWGMRPPSPRVSRLALPSTPGAAAQVGLTGPDIAITADGTRVVYVTGLSGGGGLAVRPLDASAPIRLNLGNGGGPFISLDGAWMGYYDVASASIKKVPILGGPSVAIVDQILGLRGATWTPDDSIIYGTATPDGLWRIPSGGGTPSPLTHVDPAEAANNHVWPHILPGGHAALFTIMSASVESAQIAVVDLETKRYRVIIPKGTYPKYSPTGHILYVSGGTLFAVGFDLDSLTVTTPTPIPVADGVLMKESGAADFDISANGTLVYIAGGGDLSQRSVAWVDRGGKQQLLPAVEPGAYHSLSVGPGGRQIVIEEGPAGDGNLWIYDVARATHNPLTSGAGDDRNPLWTPDGQRIVFASKRDGRLGVFAINADGTGSIDRLATVPGAAELWPQSWSKDGKTLVVSVAGAPQTAADILDIRIDSGTVEPRIVTPLVETQPAVSSTGDLVAYMVLRENRPGIYVERYPTLGERRTVSTGPGLLPRWSGDGLQLFYFALATEEMMAVPVSATRPPIFGTPKPLFKVPLYQSRGWRSYDVMPDGRFVMILRGNDAGITAPTPMVVQNFSEELKRLVPTK